MSVKTGIKGSFLMREKTYILEVDGLMKNDCLKFNHNLSGVFICNYLAHREPGIPEDDYPFIRDA